MGLPSMLLAGVLALATMAGATDEPPPPANLPGLTVILPEMPAIPPKTEAAVQVAKAADVQARQAYGKDNVKAAVAFATQAFEAVPNAATALILSFYLGKSDGPGAPCRALSAALVAADLDPTEEELRRIDRQLAEVSQRCGAGFGWVRLTVSQGGAVATIDGGEAIQLPRTVGLSAGGHDIVVTAPGQQLLQSRVSVVSGRQATMALNLTPEIVDLGEPKPEPIKLSTVGWALLGTGLALCGGAAGAHVWGLDQAAIANTNATAIPGLRTSDRQARYDDAQANSELATILAGVGYGLGGAALVTAVVLLLVQEGEPSEDSATVTVRPHGAAFSVQF